ncbi:MAG: bifunctional class I SAM-dependent methyltransferase/glycosyltransferase family 2 protein [Kiritimatiellales bacterium]
MAGLNLYENDLMNNTTPSAKEHLARIAAFYNVAEDLSPQAQQYRRMLANHYNLLIPPFASVLEIGCGGGDLLALLSAQKKTGVDLSERQIERARQRVPGGRFHVQSGEELSLDETFDYIIVSDTVNYAADVQQLLNRLHEVSHPETRLIVNFYNTLWRPLLTLATRLGLSARQPQSSWLARSDILMFMNMADWDVLKTPAHILMPATCFGLGKLINRCLAPLFPCFCLALFCVARPVPRRAKQSLSVSVVIPARNEAGNIEAAVLRTPRMGSSTELIFVEGGSSDHTWEEMQRVAQAFPDRGIRCIRQQGKGKGDAVRAGFAQATGDVLMILDADLTTPPEDLLKFYDVIATGRAEFANGVRLIYPMEDKAMQFLNLCANKVFSLLFTWFLEQPVKDTLCGTKVLRRSDYERLAANRSYFGEFDPFGDFDLLFGAGKLNFKIADVAVRYAQRTYGSTNISRWKHGWLLIRMAWVAAKKLKFAR